MNETNVSQLEASTSVLEPFEFDPHLEHVVREFELSDVQRFYVRERRKHCTHMQLMNLWLVVPHCYDCAVSRSFDGSVNRYVTPKWWESDILQHAGEGVLRRTKRLLRTDPDFAYRCKGCSKNVRPWQGDEMDVGKIHLEEGFSVPTETPGRRRARNLTSVIKQLYGHRCFGCGKRQNKTRRLHIDHVLPQSKGGTAAFRNLQPLCEPCGNAKADKMPDEVDVYSTIFFGPYPSDSYEGLFW